MPEMSGFDVFRRLQSDPRTSGIKVIVNTSMRLTATDKGRLIGAAAFISKEHLERDTVAAVRDVLDSVGATGKMTDTGN
jgi:CheY-like chemotaxis protein